MSGIPRRAASVFALVIVAVGLAAGAGLASSHDASLDQIYLNGLSAGDGGDYGYYLKSVGGPVLLAHNESYVYDPASALKALYLALAMRQVASGAESLSNPVSEYRYPNSPNEGGNPASPTLCPDPPDETPENAVSPAPSLLQVLTDMMQISDNRATRAIEIRYGRNNLNALASSLGMSSTYLDQIIGCGYRDGQRNGWTLADAGKLYEGISNGTAVPAAQQDELYTIMLNSGPLIDFTTLQSIANSLGITDFRLITSFLTDVHVRYKGGSYDIGCGDCGSDNDVITRDEAGLFTVPFATPNGETSEDYVFGSFITGEAIQCPSSGCQPEVQAGNAVQAGINTMLQQLIVSAFKSYASVTLLSSFGTRTRTQLKLTGNLSTEYTKALPTGQQITFKIGNHVFCSGTTDSQGVATCSGPPPKTRAKQYTAQFAGADGLFPADDFGPLPALPVALTVNRQTPLVGGVVVSTPPGITCGQTCKPIYSAGTAVTLVAKPRRGFKFLWGGACKTRSRTCRLTVNKATTATIAWAKA